MKFKKNYYLKKELLYELLKEAGLNKVSFIVPFADNAFNYVYRVKADNNSYLLKVQKENNKMLTLETNKMQNDIEAYDIIRKNTDNSLPTLVYTNADYIEKKVEKPEHIFSLYKYILATPYSELQPNGEEKKQFYFQAGQIIGDFTNIKSRVFGSPSIGFDSNWFGAFSKMVDTLIEDEKRLFKKPSKDLLELKDRIQSQQALLITVKATFVHFNVNRSNLYYLNRKVDMIVTNPGEYFYGDYLADFTGIRPLVRLEKKVYMAQGFGDTSKILFEVTDDIKIRYYLLLIYKAIVLRDKEKTRHHTLFNNNLAKMLALSKAMIALANKELNSILAPEEPRVKVNRRMKKASSLNELIQDEEPQQTEEKTDD